MTIGAGGMIVDLTKNPSLEELSYLLSSVDDDECHHIIWVDINGVVHITPLNDELSPAGWAELNDHRIQFRYETFVQGNGYVGEKAALDKDWVNRLFSELLKDWREGRKGYIDY